MLTGKQKRYLRAMAVNLRPVFQIGKEGLSENLKTQLHKYLKKHELMKISLLNNAPLDKKELAKSLRNDGIFVVQTIGNMMVLYKPNPDLEERIVLP